MNNDPLANVMSNILNAEKIGKKQCVVRPISVMIKTILDIMKTHHYIGDYTETNDGRGGYITINLIGKINNCCVIKPRLSVKKEGFEKFEKRHLPAKDFGLLIVSTPKGVMTQSEAKQNATGGTLIAYVY